MASKDSSDKKTPDPFTPKPLPKIGVWVQFLLRGDADSKPVPAVVTDVNERDPSMVQLHIVHRDRASFQMTPSWVRHVDDPDHEKFPQRKQESGAWRHV